MSVPTNLIPTLITGLQEYTGSSTLGYMPYIIDGRTYKVQFANIAAVGAVPSSRVIAAGTGLAGGGDLSANRVISIANGGVGFDQLALSGVTQGTYGSGSAIPILTVDSKGRITSATTAALDVTGFVPTSRTITAGDGLTGGGALTSNVTLAANFSAATPSALGTASAGTAITVSRGDHVHPAVNLSDTSQTQGALPLGRGGTGDALSPVAGAVVYSTGSKFALTNPGIAGQVLVSTGTDEPQWQTILGTGTVTSVSVSTANGFAGFVANPATVPDITLSTTVTGMLKGDGTGMSAATAGVDYVEPGPYTTSGLTMASARLLGRTTASVGAAQEITVGTGLTLSGGSLVNAAPDQVVALTGGTAISVTGTYPSFTITNTAPDQTVSLTAGTAISISGTYPSFSVTNTAPDQVVSLTGAGTTTVTGTYPSFTITSNDSTSGTVTSVNASGGTTGMSFTGGPITSAGTLTLNGTLAVANGGTGATDAATALTNLGAYPASNPAGYTSNVGTVTSVSGTGTVSGLSLSGTVTSAGSLTLGGTLAVTPSDFASQTANTVLAAPNGSAGVPTFRSLVAADVPTLNQNTTGTASNVTGIVAVANGGTGASVASTARTNLSAAASGANTDITSIALTTGTISTSPVSGTDIVNKAYADSIASGINFHQSVRLATAAALPTNTYDNGTSGVGATLTATTDAPLVVDGVTVVVGNRILVKNEATQANNGVYVVTQVGDTGGGGPGPGGGDPYILTRATDFDSAGTGVDQIDAGDFFLVTAGSTLANTSWVQQTPLPITVGTTAIVFSQFAAPVLYSAGTGLSLAGTVFSITNTGVSASTYGSASSVPVIAVNAQGQITSASASSIAIAASQITSGALAIANGGTGATSAATALTNLGAYPASNPSGFTSNTGTVTSVNLTAGTGVSVSGGPITASGSITVTNTAPDQVVSLTGSGATTVTGTYPNFTISSPTSGAGTVTSIDVSGGTTGLTTSGGPVTSSGTITLAGTLNVANGGTGATTLSSGYLLKGNGTSAVSASVVYDDGTNAMIGTTTALGRLTIQGNTNANLDAWIRNDNAGSSSRAGLVLNASGNSWRMGMGSTANNSNALTWNVDIGGANTEYMRLTTGGNLGLGTASPTAISGYKALTLDAGTGTFTDYRENGTLRLRIGGDAGAGFINGSSGTLRLLTSDTDRLTINSSGNVTAAVDMRAPIFYDSNNTAYYLDAAGNSVFSAFNIGGGEVYFYGSATNAVSIRTGAGGAYRYFTFDASGNFYALNGSVYGQRFYDQDNTAYYADPAGTSNFNQINLGDSTKFIRGGGSGQTILGVGSVNDAYLQVGGSYYPIWNSGNFTPGNYLPLTGGTLTGTLTIQTSGDAQLYLNGNGTSWAGIQWTDVSGSDNMWYNGSTSTFAIGGGGSFVANKKLHINGGTTIGSGIAASASGTNSLLVEASITANQMYAQIFYDSQNGAYYVDPASTSNLNVLNVQPNSTTSGGGINFNGAGNSFIRGTSTDGASYLGTNLQLQSWFGIGFGPSISGQLVPIGENAAWIDCRNGDLTARRVLVAQQDARAPIFYDNNNTAYYINGDGTSNLAGLTVANEITGNISGYSRYLPTAYIGGQRLNPQDYFGQGIGLKVAMTAVAGVWSDTLWINGYSGGDVLNMCALHTSRQATPRMWISSQASNGTSYGTLYEFPTLGYNSGNTNGLYAGIYYDSANTARYFDGTTGINFTTGSSSRVTVYSDDSGLHVANGEGVGGDVRLGAAYNLPGLYNNPNLYLQSESGIYFHTGNTQRGYFDGSSNLFANASMRAPIFYDSNNTNYYLNPAEVSVTWRMGANYFQNNDAVSTDTPFGLYFDNALSSAYAIFREGGAWTHPYPDLRIAFHTGIKMGANSGYGGMKFYTDYDMSSQVMSINNSSDGLGAANVFINNALQVNGDIRTPIFYDVNDTAYYLNPNSTGTSLNVAGSIIAAGNVTAYSDVRLKANIETIPSALDKLDQIRGVTYTRTDLEDKEQRYAGVIAQEIEAVLPEAVRDLGDIKAVDYNATIALLIQAVKELRDEVEALRK